MVSADILSPMLTKPLREWSGPGETWTLRVYQGGDHVVTISIEGTNLDAHAAQRFIEGTQLVMQSALAAGKLTHLFVNTLKFENYHAVFRRDILIWLKANRSSLKKITLVVQSPLIALGVNMSVAVLGADLVEVHRSPEAFVAAFLKAINS